MLLGEFVFDEEEGGGKINESDFTTGSTVAYQRPRAAAHCTNPNCLPSSFQHQERNEMSKYSIA